jgi:hypothetical protein
VPYLDCRNALSVSEFFTTTKRRTQPAAALVPVLLLTLNCFAQDQPQTSQPPNSPPSQTQAEIKIGTVTIPAGTRIALVLTHPIQSRYMHRGDDIYAEITAPITMGNEVVIPPGTLVDGKVDKLERRGGRAELKLQSLSITFPDGYVAPVPGPAALESVEGYALTDPGSRRMVGMFALPAAGAGLGALIGHSIGKPQSEVSSNFPPGCIGAPPFCTSITTPVFGTQAKDAIIGAGIGGAIGAVSSMALLFSSHQFSSTWARQSIWCCRNRCRSRKSRSKTQSANRTSIRWRSSQSHRAPGPCRRPPFQSTTAPVTPRAHQARHRR